MKILIAYDGSSCADLALEDMRRAGLPRLAEAMVLSVSELWMPVVEGVGAGSVRIVGALPVSLEKAESLCVRKSATQALEAFEAIAQRMVLTINREKTRITKLTAGFDFIGFHFVKRCSPKSGKLHIYIFPSKQS